MSGFNCYVGSCAASEAPSLEEVNALLARCEWFSLARIVRENITGDADARLALTAPWRGSGSLQTYRPDIPALLGESADDVIDRFLRERNLRIVAGEGEPEAEVRTTAELNDDDDVVSEELAEIYLAQGFQERAASIYRKLSLRNPEKSVYFAELIAKFENK